MLVWHIEDFLKKYGYYQIEIWYKGKAYLIELFKEEDTYACNEYIDTQLGGNIDFRIRRYEVSFRYDNICVVETEKVFVEGLGREITVSRVFYFSFYIQKL